MNCNNCQHLERKDQLSGKRQCRGVNRPLWHLLHSRGITQPRKPKVWKPSRAIKPGAQTVDERGTGVCLVFDEAKVEGCVRHNVKGAGLVNQAIGNLLFWYFVLECAKNPVPNRQEASIVLVQTVPVGTVVNPVVGGKVEDKTKGTQVANQLGVDPKLVEKVQLRVHQHHWGWDGKGQRKVEPVGQPGQTLQYWLSGHLNA